MKNFLLNYFAVVPVLSDELGNNVRSAQRSRNVASYSTKQTNALFRVARQLSTVCVERSDAGAVDYYGHLGRKAQTLLRKRPVLEEF